MIPIRDENSTNETPYTTYALMSLNILVWFLVQGAGTDEALSRSVCEYGFVPAALFTGIDGAACSTVHVPSFLSIFTSMFMHGGWMHLLGNMLFLWVFGDNVEDSMGHARFLVFYLLGGVFAALAQGISDSGAVVPMVGASGAIGAVMGAYLFLYPKVKVTIAVFIVILFWTFRVPAYLMLGYWIAVQAISAASTSAAGGGIAFWAHIGGFLSGILLVQVFKSNELLTNHAHYGWRRAERAESIWDDPRNQQ